MNAFVKETFFLNSTTDHSCYQNSVTNNYIHYNYYSIKEPHEKNKLQEAKWMIVNAASDLQYILYLWTSHNLFPDNSNPSKTKVDMSVMTMNVQQNNL